MPAVGYPIESEANYMGLCNYCKFRILRKKALEGGLKVTTKTATWGMGGVEVFVHPKDVVIEEGAGKEDHPQKKYWKCWYMSLPNCCAC